MSLPIASDSTVAVAHIDLDEARRTGNLDELDILALVLAEIECDEMWGSIVTSQASSAESRVACGRLGISPERACVARGATGAQAGTILLGNLVAYIGGFSRLVVYDCSSEKILRDSTLRADETGGGLYGRLSALDRFYKLRSVGGVAEQLGGIRDRAARGGSEVGEIIRDAIQPILDFMRVYEGLLTRLPRRDYETLRVSDVDALGAVSLAREAERMRQFGREMAEAISGMEHIERALEFFLVGRRYLAAFGESHGHGHRRSIDREAVATIFGWFSCYYLAAAREAESSEQFNASLLLLNRAMETFMLAYLWRRGLVTRRGGTFRLTDGKAVTSANLWRAFRDIAPAQYVARVEAPVDLLRELRNGNLMVHGFHVPRAEDVDRARRTVKLAIQLWEEQCVRGVGLIRGPIGDFFAGEQWGGSLGSNLASSVVMRLKKW